MMTIGGVESGEPGGGGTIGAVPEGPPLMPLPIRVVVGAPSQLDLFDHKPELIARDGQVCPESLLEGRRFAFIGRFAGRCICGRRRIVCSWIG